MNSFKFRRAYTAIAAAAVLTTTAAAWAATAPAAGPDSAAATNDAMAVANNKVSLTQAIAAAEQHANGKASKAEYEQTKAGWAYDVEVISGAKVFDVKVDATQGTVISSAEDQIDRGEDREARGEHRDHDRGQNREDHEDDDKD